MISLTAGRTRHRGDAPGVLDAVLGFGARSHAHACAILLALCLACFLPGFASLQPMDRDEPRFAQATKQMLETGDFVDIRFQDEARYKKPIGIHWLQAAAVAAGEALGVPGARTTIALYRIPSLLGALAAVLLTYWAALAFATRREAFLAAALIGASLMLVGRGAARQDRRRAARLHASPPWARSPASGSGAAPARLSRADACCCSGSRSRSAS